MNLTPAVEICQLLSVDKTDCLSFSVVGYFRLYISTFQYITIFFLSAT